MRTILYKTYSFKNKDPIIDLLRTALRDSGKSYWDVQRETNVSASCLWNWFEGETKRPSFAAVKAVAECLGCELELKFPGHRANRPKLRVVGGRP